MLSCLQACKADVQQFCAGTEPGNGQVHDCLRRSAEHLSPACRAAEEDIERMEHEDVRLNPKIQRWERGRAAWLVCTVCSSLVSALLFTECL